MKEQKPEKQEQSRTKRHRKNEGILILVLLLSVCGYLLWRQLASAQQVSAGGEVVVQAGGQEYARLPLQKDAELDIAQGEWHNYLVIQNGTATVREATCPDKQCVHQADICRKGEMIVCLPNQVLITIEGGEKSEEAGPDVDGRVR